MKEAQRVSGKPQMNGAVRVEHCAGFIRQDLTAVFRRYPCTGIR